MDLNRSRLSRLAARQFNRDDAGKMQRLTVLMVRVGGWEEWVHTVARFLAVQGFNVVAVCFLYGKTFERVKSDRGGYPLVEITVPSDGARNVLKIVRGARAMRRELGAIPHDVLYAVDTWTLQALWVASRGGFRFSGKHFVYHTFEWIEPGNHSLVQVFIERAACRMASVVVSVEPVRARLVQKLYGLSRQPVWVRNSLPLDFETPPRDEGLRQGLLRGAPENAVLVICPSIVSPSRRSFELLRALRLLPERYRLTTIAPDGGYGDECRHLAKELGISQRVVFRPPMAFREVMAYIASSDIGIALHDGGESVGNYLAAPMRLSQMAVAGVPLIASAYPAVEAVVYRYELGICCDDSSPDDIARAIRELSEAGPGLSERGLRARAAFEKDLHFEKRAEGLSAALRKLG